MTEIIAEISCNHGGVLKNALQLISDAKKAGADAVKFQCFDPVKLAERRKNNMEVLNEAKGESLLDIYKKAWTPRSWFPALISRARTHKLPWFSSVFSPEDVDYLEGLQCPRYKISAFEMLDWELIRAVKATGKPIIMSVRHNSRVTVLHASDYKGAFDTLGASWHVSPPFDPRLPPGVPMIEMHLRLEGVDTFDKEFSLTCGEMAKMIGAIRGLNNGNRSKRNDLEAGNAGAVEERGPADDVRPRDEGAANGTRGSSGAYYDAG